MSLEKHKDETEESEDEKESEKEAGPSQDEKEENKGRRDKRVLRFQLPEGSAVESEESFTSAMSFALADDSRENIVPPPTTDHLSTLRKFISHTLNHSRPRNISLNPCFKLNVQEIFIDDEIHTFSPLPSSSSKLLFEVIKNSPTPSEADIYLINSTYLRKLEAVKEAIKNGADINTFREWQTPLLIATEIGDHRLVSYFLTVPNVNPDFQNVFGQTPLIIAVRNAFDKIVKLLLSHNADVNIADNMGKTPLHGALFQQRPHMARLLLAYGADIPLTIIRKCCNQTRLMDSASNNSIRRDDAITFLKKSPLRKNTSSGKRQKFTYQDKKISKYEIQDCFGERPMYTSAVKKPHLECLLILLRSGANPNYGNITGVPLLSRAILNWTEFSILEALIMYGASVNALDFITRKTPLHFAAMTDNVRIAKLLISRGADPNIRTVYNYTPYDEAICHKSLEVANFLLNITHKISARKRYSTNFRY